jgi:hypothetical protein
MKRLLRKFGVPAGDAVEARVMQLEGSAVPQSKLKLAS